ncbi:histidine kinase N-terminal 7TM domain-containing protein [Haloarchaeobius iranensis]|uniref:N-terminal 7TM region of histidine kinase n=1 Tax=Haloarchaeobius iranensis TaxID=996166 RepID=A0A1G9VB28_9EURY|nr:histidine kinase N-terminal 7TM domain-containing protein [Haloarchaeobius iranensis]SDM69257.1 N-terminal 7TM region of histidine kinase [Haloarchaeobius iranensis]
MLLSRGVPVAATLVGSTALAVALHGRRRDHRSSTPVALLVAAVLGLAATQTLQGYVGQVGTAVVLSNVGVLCLHVAVVAWFWDAVDRRESIPSSSAAVVAVPFVVAQGLVWTTSLYWTQYELVNYGGMTVLGGESGPAYLPVVALVYLTVLAGAAVHAFGLLKRDVGSGVAAGGTVFILLGTVVGLVGGGPYASTLGTSFWALVTAVSLEVD